MPIYEYVCQDCEHEFETIQRMSDEALTRCPACGKDLLRKKISAVAFRLKGGGWYETDFKSGDKKNVASSSDSGESASSSGESTKDTKNETKPSSSSSGGSSSDGSSTAASGSTNKPAKEASKSGDKDPTGDKRGASKGAAKRAPKGGPKTSSGGDKSVKN